MRHMLLDLHVTLPCMQVMVFFSSCNSVKYHAELLNYVDIPVRDIHGKQKQAKRTSTFFEFCAAETGTLLCTDVAARGLDIPGASASRLVLCLQNPKGQACTRTSSWGCTLQCVAAI